MCKTFNCNIGYFELPSEILGVGIYGNFIEFDCQDGMYKGGKDENGTLIVIKFYDKDEKGHLKRINSEFVIDSEEVLQWRKSE